MSTTLLCAAYALALVAAARSTWSPCGLSMLSSLNPIGEAGRGHRFASTAAWYVAGALAGGATLGAALLAVAAGVRALDPPGSTVLAIGALVAAAGAAADLGLLGFRLPLVRRQVNERWLDRYRSWAYAGGFGWQIGVGFSTYVMTSAVAVVVVLAAASGAPWPAFGVGVAFGAARGITVLANRRVVDPASLIAAHRRYAAWRRPVWLAAVGAQLAVAAALGAVLWAPAPAVAAAVAVGLLAARGPARLAARAGEPAA